MPGSIAVALLAPRRNTPSRLPRSARPALGRPVACPLVFVPLLPPLQSDLARRCQRTAAAALVGGLLLTLALRAHADDAGDIRTLLQRGESAAALARAEAAIAAQPRDAGLRFLRGVALIDLARDADALAHFEAMCQEYPDLPDAWNNVALLQVRAGRLEAGRVALQSALRADPSHRIARANLGLVYLMLAAEAWEQLAGTGPVDPALVRRLEAVRALLAGASR